jgi:hypothetical protein
MKTRMWGLAVLGTFAIGAGALSATNAQAKNMGSQSNAPVAGSQSGGTKGSNIDFSGAGRTVPWTVKRGSTGNKN